MHRRAAGELLARGFLPHPMMRSVECHEKQHRTQKNRTAPNNSVRYAGRIIPAHHSFIVHEIAAEKGYDDIKFEARARMASRLSVNWAGIARAGILAGIAGCIAFVLFVYLTSLLPVHASILAIGAAAASDAMGKSGASSPAIGFVFLLAAAIGWAVAYAYLAHTRPIVNKKPLVSGFIFGAVVYVVMQFVLFSVQALKVPDVLSVYLGLLAATVFFGIPVAAVARVR
jgi:hypothetical protein